MAETFSEIKGLVRDLSNQHNESDLSNSQLESYINNWYQNKAHLELNHSLERTWRLQTISGVDKYDVDAEYRYLTGDCRINGDYLQYFVDSQRFYAQYEAGYKHLSSIESGDGSTTIFTGTLSLSGTIVAETIVFGDSVESFRDDGDGALIGSEGGSGTIDYDSGAWLLSFVTAPVLSDKISCSYSVLSHSIPDGVLYYNADTEDGGEPELTFRPIPDSTYNIELDYEASPTALASDTDEPIYKSWGDLIAYGTAIDITERFGLWNESEMLKRAYTRIRDVVKSGMARIEKKRIKIPRW